jgi:threonylcarbamoyladenosine tRNA methylthiotransferase MtaB
LGCLDFPGLLASLLAGTERVAFRVSSYEPSRIDAAFLEVAGHERVRPFFHLPIQSGSPATLSRMGRDPDTGALDRAIDGLRRLSSAGLPRDPFISVDMICGFPGESQAEFEESAAFARRARPAWIHVFPYSPRPGTPAASFPDRVPERVAAERARLLSGIAREGRAEYAGRWMGREVDAVLEGKLARPDDASNAGTLAAGEAFTANALRVELFRGPGKAGPEPARGAGIRLRLEPPKSAAYDASAII